MRDDWLEPPQTDEEPERASGRRAIPRPLLVALASAPWLLVVALLVVPGRLATGFDTSAAEDDSPVRDDAVSIDANQPAVDDPTAARATGEPDGGRSPHHGSVDEPDAAAGARSPGAPDPLPFALEEIRGVWRVEPGIEEAAALAVLAARGWLTGIEPALAVGGITPRDESTYAEHVVVEAVEQPADGAAVITVVASVLDLGGTEAVSSVVRLAVPLVLGEDGPRLTGPPWELPPPDLRPVDLPRQQIEDPTELAAALDAIREAGLVDHEIVGLASTSGWPVVATLAHPAHDGRTELWLRRHLDGFVVAGTTLAGHRAPTSTKPVATADRETHLSDDPPDDPGYPRAPDDSGPAWPETDLGARS